MTSSLKNQNLKIETKIAIIQSPEDKDFDVFIVSNQTIFLSDSIIIFKDNGINTYHHRCSERGNMMYVEEPDIDEYYPIGYPLEKCWKVLGRAAKNVFKAIKQNKLKDRDMVSVEFIKGTCYCDSFIEAKDCNEKHCNGISRMKVGALKDSNYNVICKF